MQIKNMVEEKEKRASIVPGSRWTQSKNLEASNQEVVDKYLASYGFRLNLVIKIEFFPQNIDVSVAPPNKEGAYMYP